MKNIYLTSLFVASSALLLAGCSEDNMEVEAPQSNTPIAFAPYVEDTRAYVAGVETLKEEGFQVWIAHNKSNTYSPTQDNTNYLYDEEVYFFPPLDAWDYFNKRFWPTDDAKLSFFAITNGGDYLSTEHQKGDAGAPAFLFDCPGEFEDQVDLVAAQDLDMPKTTNQIRFDFQHMLSKIRFDIKATIPEHSIAVLQKVEVFYKSNAVCNQAVVDLNDLSIVPVEDAYYDGPVEELSAGVLFEDEEGVLLDEMPIALGRENDFLMLIPQAYEEGDFYLRMTYFLDTEDQHYADTRMEPIPTWAGPSFRENHVAEKIDLPICVDEMDQNIGLLKGKQYTYHIEINPKTVNFNGEITVNNWNDPYINVVKDETQTPQSEF